VFEQAGAVVLAISPQDVDSHERWATQERFPFALLADTDQAVIHAYGLEAPLVGVRRSIFLVDTAGIVRWRYSGTVRAIFKRPQTLGRILATMD
jgi:thioredoxin-dependent peroxiredoxin